MPIYEFECKTCGKKSGYLVMSRERVDEVRCKKCGSAELERLWSRFSSPKSEEARLESLADPSAMSGIDENDPQSVARYMKKMGKEMGEDLGEDFDQALEEGMADGGLGAPGEGAAGGADSSSDDL